MQLRFRGSDTDSEHFGDFLVLKTFDIVQHENGAVPARQFLDRFVKRQTIHVMRSLCDRLDNVLQVTNFTFFGRLFVLHAAFAEVHQDMIDRHPMQPGRKGRFAAKTADLAEKLNEDFLCQIFRLGRVGQHAQAQTVDAPVMALVKRFESLDVSTR